MAISFAPNFLSLTLFSTLLGFGPAIFTPAGVGIIGAKFPEGRKKNLAFSFLGLGQPFGFILGLFLSAFFAEINWRIALWLQSGVGALFTLTSFLSLPPNRTLELFMMELEN